MPSASYIEDSMWLEQAAQRKKQKQQDERLVEQVEKIQDTINNISSKEQKELNAIERTKDYYRNQIFFIQQSTDSKVSEIRTIAEKRIQSLEEESNKKIHYFEEQLKLQEEKQDLLRKKYETEQNQKQRKQNRIANKVNTPHNRELINEVIMPTNNIIVPQQSDDEKVKKAEIEFRKMLEEQQQAQKEIKRIFYEPQLIENTKKLKQAENELKDLKNKQYPDDDAIFLKENEIGLLKQERFRIETFMK